MPTRSSTCCWVNIPREQAMLTGIPAARMARIPSHLVQQPAVWTAYRGHDAELGCPGGRGVPRGSYELGNVQPGRADRRGELTGLRAEVTVLGAAAGLEADDALDLHLRAAPAQP